MRQIAFVVVSRTYELMATMSAGGGLSSEFYRAIADEYIRALPFRLLSLLSAAIIFGSEISHVAA